LPSVLVNSLMYMCHITQSRELSELKVKKKTWL
jgi:hypothetical protein